MGRGRRSRRAERLRSEDGIDGLPHSWPGPDLSDDAPLDARVRDVLGTTPSDDDDEPPLARALEEEPAAAGARSGVPGGPGPEPARRHAEPEHRPHCPDLPAECVSLILAQLSDALDLVACQQLGRTWRQCATEEALWHKLCVETWPISCYKPQPADPASARTSWRKQYARARARSPRAPCAARGSRGPRARGPEEARLARGRERAGSSAGAAADRARARAARRAAQGCSRSARSRGARCSTACARRPQRSHCRCR